MPQFKTALENNDYKKLYDFVHSITGASRNLQLDIVYTQAKELNDLLKDKESFSVEEIKIIQNLVEKLLALKLEI